MGALQDRPTSSSSERTGAAASADSSSAAWRKECSAGLTAMFCPFLPRQPLKRFHRGSAAPTIQAAVSRWTISLSIRKPSMSPISTRQPSMMR